MSEEVKTQEQSMSKKMIVYLTASTLFLVSDILSFFFGFKLTPETTETIKQLAMVYMGTHAATDITSIIGGKK